MHHNNACVRLCTLPKLRATAEDMFICTPWGTWAGFCGVTATRFAAVQGRRVIAGAGSEAIATPRTLITPFGPLAVQHRAIVTQRAPALRETIAR